MRAFAASRRISGVTMTDIEVVRAVLDKVVEGLREALQRVEANTSDPGLRALAREALGALDE